MLVDRVLGCNIDINYLCQAWEDFLVELCSTQQLIKIRLYGCCGNTSSQSQIAATFKSWGRKVSLGMLALVLFSSVIQVYRRLRFLWSCEISHSLAWGLVGGCDFQSRHHTRRCGQRGKRMPGGISVQSKYTNMWTCHGSKPFSKVPLDRE